MSDNTEKAGPAAPPAPSSDESDLEKKKQDLATAKAEADTANGRAAALTAEIKALEARIADAKKATDAYKEQSSKLQQDLNDAEKQLSQKSAMAVAALKDQKDAVDKVIQSVDQDLAAQATKLGALQTSAQKAQQDWADADAKAKAKQDAYTAAKQVQKTLEDRLKQIKDLLDQAGKAETQGDVISMYFLLQEASAAAKDLNVASPDDYTAAVKTAQSDAESARAIAAERKGELDTQNKQLADASAQLTAATAARRTTILTKLKQIRIPAAAASGSAR